MIITCTDEYFVRGDNELMILDVLENAAFHVERNKGFAEAFKFLQRPDLKDLPAGKYPIDGDRVYAMIAIEPGRGKEGALLEAHRNYIDIQLVLEGVDEMGWRPLKKLHSKSGEYYKINVDMVKQKIIEMLDKKEIFTFTF